MDKIFGRKPNSFVIEDLIAVKWIIYHDHYVTGTIRVGSNNG
jgi:hypothetical protein